MWNIKTFHSYFKVSYQGLYETGKDVMERKFKACEFQQMVVGFGDQPSCIGTLGQKIYPIYASYAVKDPGCRDFVGIAEKPPTVLVD